MQDNLVLRDLQRVKGIKNIILLADLHLGVRASSEEWQDNIRDYFYNFFFPFLKSHKFSKKDTGIFILGDVFDNRKAINIAVNNLAIDIIESMCKLHEVWLINGNHDLYRKTSEGETSLRSFINIKGLHIITEPSHLVCEVGDEERNMLMLPYLGNGDEPKYLKEYRSFDYAFMHNELKTMKFDNGQAICSGADPKDFGGMIYAGHIHKRQESKNAVYVGSPYHTRRSDIGNVKGVYCIDLRTKLHTFYENSHSPVFQKVHIDTLDGLTEQQKASIFNNNYNDLIVPEEYIKSKKVKVNELYDISLKYKSKRFEIISVKNDAAEDNQTETIDIDLRHIDIESLIDSNINALPDIPQEQKNRLKELNSNYFKAAMCSLENDEGT